MNQLVQCIFITFCIICTDLELWDESQEALRSLKNAMKMSNFLADSYRVSSFNKQISKFQEKIAERMKSYENYHEYASEYTITTDHEFSKVLKIGIK